MCICVSVPTRYNQSPPTPHNTLLAHSPRHSSASISSWTVLIGLLGLCGTIVLLFILKHWEVSSGPSLCFYLLAACYEYLMSHLLFIRGRLYHLSRGNNPIYVSISPQLICMLGSPAGLVADFGKPA